MRRIATIALVWLCLFGVTLGIRALAAGGGESSEDLPRSPTDDVLLKEMSAHARRTLFLADARPDTAPFDDQLRTFMMKHDAGLRRCRASIKQRNLERPKEFIEVSFIPLKLEPTMSISRVVLDAIVFERSTIALSQSEQQCIADEFSRFELDVSSDLVPNDRMPFQFCFGNLTGPDANKQERE